MSLNENCCAMTFEGDEGFTFFPSFVALEYIKSTERRTSQIVAIWGMSYGTDLISPILY